MLVLSRKVGERIHLGNNIVIEIRKIGGDRVSVGLVAPRDVQILRGELVDQAAKGAAEAGHVDAAEEVL